MKTINYFYKIGATYSLIDSLTEARKYQKYLIKKDAARFLYRDGQGRFFIEKIYCDERPTKIIY